MKKQHVLFTIMILLAAGLTGCNKAEPGKDAEHIIRPAIVTPQATETPLPEPTNTQPPTSTPLPTVTTTPQETLTPVPTVTLPPEATSTPQPTSTPVPTAANTPVPTITEPTPNLSKSETIPVIWIETENGQSIVSRDEYVNCSITLYNVPEEYQLKNAEAGIRVRGNSSAYYGNVQSILTKEVPYRIKFDQKTNLLGLNDGAECKSWILLRCDEGLMREEAAMAMGRVILGDKYFCSDSEFVHLYVNGEFKWLTLLCEQSQVNKHRVNITEPEKNYTGTDIGYFLEIDNYANADDHPFFKMDYNNSSATDYYGETQPFSAANYTIKSDIYSETQEEFIKNYTRNLFTLVYDACVNKTYWALDENNNLIASPYDNAEDTIDAVMNLDSVVRMYILDEIVHDYDCGEGSFYMCVDFAGDSSYPKMTFVCPWDFEWTYFGKAQGQYYAGVFNPDEAWLAKYGDRANPWYVLLMTQDWFLSMVKEQWAELHAKQALEAVLAEERAYIKEYKSDLNRPKAIATDTGLVILNWIEKRIQWLDEVWLEP